MEVLHLIKLESKVGDTEIFEESSEYSRCDSDCADDEIHALLYCTKFQVERGKLVQQVCKLYNRLKTMTILKNTAECSRYCKFNCKIYFSVQVLNRTCLFLLTMLYFSTVSH